MMHGARTVFVGFALAVILTGLPFAAVMGKWLPREQTLWLVGLAAIIQIAVHLRFFLGIRFGSENQEKTGSLLFAGVLLFIMVGGTIWVMGNLNWRMMY